MEPEVNEAVESEVGDEVLGGKDLHGSGTRVMPGFEPVLDVGAVVGYARWQAYR